ncbi:MAG TPA: hypothetical protein VEI52_18565 [Terriglobales bacterium]|nr:hypothetical protein [Terriglobales bacterium]
MAKYVGLRSKPVLTAVGAKLTAGVPIFYAKLAVKASFRWMRISTSKTRNYHPACAGCWQAVGHEAAFDREPEQMKLVAGPAITTKAVESTAEAIGEDIEGRHIRERMRATQLELPIPMVGRLPVFYVEMNATGIPVVRKETEGRAGKQNDEPSHTREAKLGCVFTQTRVEEEGYPLRDEASTSYVGGIESCDEFGLWLYAGAWRRGWCGRASGIRRWSRMDLESDGTALSRCHPNRRSVSCPPSTYGIYVPNSIPAIHPQETLGDGEKRQAKQWQN